MSSNFENLKQWIADIAYRFETNSEPDAIHFESFLQEPGLATQLVDLISSLSEEHVEQERSYYSACVFALDICVAQLQSAKEMGSRNADKVLQALMDYLAQVIQQTDHSLSFWLPILNAFYDVHVELSANLRDAYLDLAGQEDDEELEDDFQENHLEVIRDMINELSELSVFDIAENFFAQSYAMPPDFFVDLLIDLYSIEEGRDIGLLTLLHPKQEVREIAVQMHEQLLNHLVISSESLSRLQAIKNWYPPSYHDQFDRWIKIQRKKEVIFPKQANTPHLHLKASEVDGSGAQGVFIHYKRGRINRLCGLLLKQDLGIKDAWVTPKMSAAEIEKYYDEAFDSTITLRQVDMDYLLLSINHFLAITIAKGNTPDLHLLEIQELLNVHFIPERIDIDAVIEQLAVQISPFTPEIVNDSLKRSKSWLNKKSFTESWYIENAHVDKLVNHCSTIIDGVKVCDLEKAIDEVFTQELEHYRAKWLFHFLWMALWLKSHASKRERLWKDSFFIAHAIYSGIPLKNIPVMYEIAYQTVLNSIETMTERRTHLSQE